eukprot:388256-Prorocentrum_minimum.AAC.1
MLRSFHFFNSLRAGKPLLLGEFGRSSVAVYPNQLFGWKPRADYFAESRLLRGGKSSVAGYPNQLLGLKPRADYLAE